MPYPEPATLAFNKVTLKALLRSARALVALGKLPEALDALDRLRLLESELGDEATLANVGKSVRVEVEGKLRAKEMKRLESLERTRRAKELEKRVGEALVVRRAQWRRVVLTSADARRESAATAAKPVHLPLVPVRHHSPPL